MANVGASTNYLILPWMLTLLMIPAGLSRIEQWTMRRTWIPVAILIASTVLLAHQKFLLAQTLPSDLDASRVSSLTMLSDQSYLELLSREPQLLDPYVYGNFRCGRSGMTRLFFSELTGALRSDFDEHGPPLRLVGVGRRYASGDGRPLPCTLRSGQSHCHGAAASSRLCAGRGSDTHL